MKKLLSALVVLALASTAAVANVPCPEFCTVSPADALNGLVLAPNSPSPIPASVYTVTVRNCDQNPIAGAAVVFEFGAGIDICTTAVHSGTTNGSGQAIVTLAGGGCLDGVANAGVVKANGLPIRTYVNVKSPDYDGAGADGVVNIVDLVNFTADDACHDYDNDNDVDISDLVIFASGYLPLHSCTLQ